jgi:hypothetical protein
VPVSTYQNVVLQDRGSVVYRLFGLGVAPFTHTITQDISYNGMPFTVYYTDSGDWELIPGTNAVMPITIERLSALLNATDFSSVTILVTILNKSNQTIDFFDITVGSAAGGGGIENMTSGQTISANLTAFPYPLPQVGEKIPVNLRGTIGFGSFFEYEVSVPVTYQPLEGDYVVTTSPSQYLPSGYVSEEVSLAQLKGGDSVEVGGVSFLFVTHSTPGEESGIVSLNQTCPSFFIAELPDGGRFPIDYCTPAHQATGAPLSSATQTTSGSITNGFQNGGTYWSEWELSRHTMPPVGIHVEGIGGQITLIELVVGD